MKWIWYSIYAVVVVLGIYAIYAVVDTIRGSGNTEKVEAKKKYEQAYFEGQRDALHGDIRIRKIDNRTYVWTKAPYSDTTKPYKDTMFTEGNYKDSKRNE